MPSGNIDTLILIKDNIQTLPEGIKMTKKFPYFFFTFANSAFYFWKFGHKEKKTFGQIED